METYIYIEAVANLIAVACIWIEQEANHSKCMHSRSSFEHFLRVASMALGLFWCANKLLSSVIHRVIESFYITRDDVFSCPLSLSVYFFHFRLTRWRS